MPCFILALLKIKIKAQPFFSSFDENASVCLWKVAVIILECSVWLLGCSGWFVCFFWWHYFCFLTLFLCFLLGCSVFGWLLGHSIWLLTDLLFAFVQCKSMEFFHLFYCLQWATPFEVSFTCVAMFNTLVFWGLFRSVMLSMSNNNDYDCIIKWH